MFGMNPQQGPNEPQPQQPHAEITVHQSVPAKVCAAFDVVRFMDSVMSPPTCAHHGYPVCEGRKLASNEQTVYNSALEVMRLYFSGECDFGPKVMAVPMMGMMPGMMLPNVNQRPPDDDGMGTPAPIEVP